MSTLRLLPFLIVFQLITSSPIQLWFAGPQNRAEVVGKSGELWFALFDRPTGVELSLTRVLVKDSLINGGEYDTFVDAGKGVEPLFLVRGDKNFHDGAIKPAFSGEQSLDPTNRNALKFTQDDPIVLLVGGNSVKGNYVNYSISLRRANIRQTLFRADTLSIENTPALLWVGDLDRDGKLDFYIRVGTVGGADFLLFLSSHAKAGQLVEHVATAQRTGD